MIPIRLALPKGKLQEATARLFSVAGILLGGYDSETRSYRPTAGMEGLKCKVFNPREIPLLVAKGYYDVGITGLDWFLETRADKNAVELLDLGFGKVAVVLAVPDSWAHVQTLDDLLNLPQQDIRVWTEYLNLAEDFFVNKAGVEPTVVSPWRDRGRGVWSRVSLFLSFGATEAKPPEDGEAIIDNMSTGRTLSANGLKVIGKVLERSTARLIANRVAYDRVDKHAAIEDLKCRLERAAPSPTRNHVTLGHL